MHPKALRTTWLLLTISILMECVCPRTLAQGRTIGNSREPGRIRDPGTTIPSNPDPKSARDDGRRVPPPETSTADIVPPHRAPIQTPTSKGDCFPPITVVEGELIGSIQRPTARPGTSTGFWILEGLRCGKGVSLGGSEQMPEYSGFDFSEVLKQPFDHPFTDMFVDENGSRLFMTVRDDSEIMDIGIAGVPLEAIHVPRQKWSSTHQVELLVDHEYLLSTWDHHYAKFVVRALLPGRVIFNWAYQYDDGRDDRQFSATRQGARNDDRFQR